MTLKRVATAYGHRYTCDGKKIMGVTTLLSKGIPKPALPNWAAKTCGEFVADNLEVINTLPDRESIIATVKQAPWSQRDRAAARGTDIHAIAEKLLHDEPVDDVPPEWLGAVEGYVKFLEKWNPEAILTERPIVNRKWWYAGTFDAVYRLPSGETILGDWKTSRGVYGETALQLSAYAAAEHYVDPEGVEQEMPEVDSLAVVHITPTGTDVYRVADREAAWKDFLHAQWVAKAEDRIKSQLGEAVEPPRIEGVA